MAAIELVKNSGSVVAVKHASTAEAYERGFNAGKAEGIEEGSAFYHAFWDGFQNWGNRKDYQGAFSSRMYESAGFSKSAFRPKYSIRPTGDGRTIFYKFPAGGGAVDMKALCEELGIELDFSQVARIEQMCRASGITKFGVLDFHNIGASTGWLMQDAKLKWVEKMILPNNPAGATGLFNDSTVLEHCPVEGTFYQSINAANCPFDIETAKSFLIALYDYSGTDKEYTYTLTFKSTVWALLDAEGATSPNGNTWREYADDKGWKT